MSRFAANKKIVVDGDSVAAISHDWFSPLKEMQIITAMQAKGGAGKTITLMALACCFVEASARVLIIDADQNTPMTIWRDDARNTDMWDERMIVESIHDSDALADRLEEADSKSEFDVVLIDTRGGTSPFNAYVAQISNLILIPARPNKLDTDNAVKTLKVVMEVEKAEGSAIEKRIVSRPHARAHGIALCTKDVCRTSPATPARREHPPRARCL